MLLALQLPLYGLPSSIAVAVGCRYSASGFDPSVASMQAVLDREHEFRFLAVQPQPLEATAGGAEPDALAVSAEMCSASSRFGLRLAHLCSLEILMTTTQG